jgi:hypothetical protein
VTTIEDWVAELRLLATVVCVTARESYDLMAIEMTTPGPEKHAIAGVTASAPGQSSPPWPASSPPKRAERSSDATVLFYNDRRCSPSASDRTSPNPGSLPLKG